MFRLETFGGLALRDAGGMALPLQRKRLALLARLASAGDRGLTRDKLGGSLWGERTQSRARHGLEQSLYSIRRELHPEIVAGTDPLRINGDLLTCDAPEFDRAIAAGDFQRAHELYRGPFLDGVFIDDAEEFERWAAGERERLRRAHVSALEHIARAADARGDVAAAVDAWRLQTIAEPVSEAAVVGLVRSLAASGDSTAALRVAEEFDQRMHRELHSAPGPSIAALVRDIRTGHVRPSSARASEVAAANRVVSVERLPHSSQAGVEPASATLPSPPRVSRRRLALVAVLFAMTAVVAAVTWRSRSGRATGIRLDRIAVLPARVVAADTSTASFAEAVTDLMAIGLDGNGVPAAADPRATAAAWDRMSRSRSGASWDDAALRTARELDAGSVLVTDVATTGGRTIRLAARILASTNGAVTARAEFSGGRDSAMLVANHLLAQLLARKAGEEEARLASLTSASLPAVVEFLQGQADRRRGHVPTALDHFERALEHDSSFALAGLELASTAGWILRWTTRSTDTANETLGIALTSRGPRTARETERWNRALAIAWRERQRLNGRDQALLRALRGPRFPGASYASEMLAVWDGAVRVAPDRAAGYFSLGSLLLFQGDAIGLVDARERARAAFNRSIERDSAFVDPLLGLLEIAGFERSIDDARRFADLYLSRDSIGPQADYVRWRAASLGGDERALLRLRSRFDTLDVATLALIERTSQIDGIAIEDADRASDAMVRGAGERAARQVALHSAYLLALNRGRPAAALNILERKRDVDPNDNLRQVMRVRGALFGDGDERAGAVSARALEDCVRQLSARAAAVASRCAPTATFMSALWRLWHDDTTGAASSIALLRRATQVGRSTSPQAELLDALLAARVGRSDAVIALARLDSLALLGCCGSPHFINLVTARLHERAGNPEAALAAVRRGRWLFPPEFLSTYLREEGRLATLTGDREGAARAYRHYLALRSAPETPLQPERDSVRARLARLDRGG